MRLNLNRICLALFGIALSFALPTSAKADLQDTYAKVKPSVVYIVCSVPDGVVSGSGFVLETDKSKSEIVTANHVVEGASTIDVILNSDPKRRYEATVVQHDHVADVAVLEIPVGHLRALSLESRTAVREGMSVAVVGYPRAATAFEKVEGDTLRPSVHAGVLSAIRVGGALYQFDAAVDHGDSGGPVINTSNGRVLGIVRGALLDPEFLALGLEQALPGSAFAMSGVTIERVIRGEPVLSATAPSGSESASGVPSSATGTVGGQSAGSGFRVGFVKQAMEGAEQQAVVNVLNARIRRDLTSDNSMYLVEMSSPSAASASLYGACEDGHLNGYVAPNFAWRWQNVARRYPFVGYMWERDVASAVGLTVRDCSGAVIFSETKSKSETKSATARPWDREVFDMDNDLIDQLEKDFGDFRASHAGAWTTFLKYGFFLDPSDPAPQAMMSVAQDKNTYRVATVFPGGPAALSGVRVGDVIDAINGVEASSMPLDELTRQTHSSQFTLTIRRPEGSVTITVVPRTYSALLTLLTRR